MLMVWAMFIGLYFAMPFDYVHAPKEMAWTIMVGGTALFCMGAIVGEWLPVARRSVMVLPNFSERAVIICAVLGFFGIACMAIDKLFLSGLDWSQGMSAVREQRSNEVMANIDIKRSAFLYIGYLTFSFSCASYALFLLRGDLMSFAARWLGQLSIGTMLFYALLYGGRMPILMVIILTAGAALARLLCGQSLLPKNNWMWMKIFVVCVAFTVYTNYIWEVRRTAGNIVDYAKFAQIADQRWEMQPSKWLDRLIRQGSIPNDLAMNWISLAMYLTHSPTTVQRMVENREHLSFYGGLYQVGILSPLADKLTPSLNLPQIMRSELMKAGIYGWFPNAWGAWFADAGIALGAVCIFVWGLLSGIAFRYAKAFSSLGAQLMLCFAYASIIISPLNGPFGMANSFLIFASFVSVALIHRFLGANFQLNRRLLNNADTRPATVE